MTETHDQFEIGEVLEQRYRIEQALARGGFGSVYRATHLALKQPVAVKLVSPEVCENARSRERLILEARALRNCQHPSTIKYLDFVESDAKGRSYLVMEFIDGENLADVLAREGTLPPERVGRLLRQLAGSLHEAHLRGIVHRDLKPENLMLVNLPGVEDFLKVIDFGLLKLERKTPTEELQSLGRLGDLTVRGMFLGTPGYAPPEAIRGGEIDGRYDIYSTGVIAFELLTGAPLFDIDRQMPEAQRIPVELYHHVSIAPRAPSRLNRTIPATLDAPILRALEKSPEQRFATMLEFADSYDAGLVQAKIELRPTVEVERVAGNGPQEWLTVPIDIEPRHPALQDELDATALIVPPAANQQTVATQRLLSPVSGPTLDETVPPPTRGRGERVQAMPALDDTVPPHPIASITPRSRQPAPNRPRINVENFTQDLPPVAPQAQTDAKPRRDLLFWIMIVSAAFFLGAVAALLIRIFN